MRLVTLLLPAVALVAALAWAAGSDSQGSLDLTTVPGPEVVVETWVTVTVTPPPTTVTPTVWVR